MGIDKIALDVMHQTATSVGMSLICCCNFPAQVLSVLNHAFCEGGRFGALQTLDHARFSSAIHRMVADGLADQGASQRSVHFARNCSPADSVEGVLRMTQHLFDLADCDGDGRVRCSRCRDEVPNVQSYTRQLGGVPFLLRVFFPASAKAG